MIRPLGTARKRVRTACADVPTRLTSGGVGEGELARQVWPTIARRTHSRGTKWSARVAVQATLP